MLELRYESELNNTYFLIKQKTPEIVLRYACYITFVRSANTIQCVGFTSINDVLLNRTITRINDVLIYDTELL